MAYNLQLFTAYSCSRRCCSIIWRIGFSRSALGHRCYSLLIVVVYGLSSGVSRMPRRMNPASWVIDIVSGANSAPTGAITIGDTSSASAGAVAAPQQAGTAPPTTDFASLFATSPHLKVAEKMVAEAQVGATALRLHANLHAHITVPC